MLRDHRAFEKPEDPSTKIWRYMDFAKFVALANDSTLFFARADKLDDPFEGSLTQVTAMRRRLVLKALYERWPRSFRADPDSLSETLSANNRLRRQWVYVNCWHMNARESAAMWRLYGAGAMTIAIQSTVGRLCACLSESSTDAVIHVGKVRYVDFDTEVVPSDDALWAYVHKRRSFAHEQELRAVIQESNRQDTNKLENSSSGMAVPVRLEGLIEKIYVAPTAPEWFWMLVKSVAEKYGLTKDKDAVLHSSLDASPIY